MVVAEVAGGGRGQGGGKGHRLVGCDDRRGVDEPSARELRVEGAGEVVVLEPAVLHVVPDVVALEADPLGLFEFPRRLGRHGFFVGEYAHHEFTGLEGLEHPVDNLVVAGLRDVALEGDVREVRLGSYVDGHVAALRIYFIH